MRAAGRACKRGRCTANLTGLHIPAVLIHEPGSTALGEKLTRLLKWARSTSISPMTELMLFNASRAQLLDEVVRPALQTGKIVICDRYTDSTIAYQGYGRRVDIETIKNVNQPGYRHIETGFNGAAGYFAGRRFCP